MGLLYSRALLKHDLLDESNKVLRKKGEIGVITAYLPRQDVYAVMFDGKIGPGNWFRFDKITFTTLFDTLPL